MPARAHILSASSKPGETGTAQVPYRLPVGSTSFAHDIRNILSSVRGYAQLLLSTTDERKRVEYLEVIESESTRCCDLMERMLRPNDSAVEGSAPESDAARAAEKACRLARGEAALKGVDLAWGTERELPPTAIPQEDLERVLLNLVRNGIQATPQGGRVEVRVGGCRLNGGAPGLEVEISDTGRGIPEYALEMIFQPFFSTHGSGEGLGLGLSISSALVERCGGSIEAKSKEGIGTTFTVRLPVRAG